MVSRVDITMITVCTMLGLLTTMAVIGLIVQCQQISKLQSKFEDLMPDTYHRFGSIATTLSRMLSSGYNNANARYKLGKQSSSPEFP